MSTPLEGWRWVPVEATEPTTAEHERVPEQKAEEPCKHPRLVTRHFTYGMQSHCPDCGYGSESWWD